jgi:transcriptional regulator with XRE-family HTH domain
MRSQKDKIMNIFKYLRKKNRMSEREISDAVGISRVTVRRCEENLLQVSPVNLEKLATYFGHKIILMPVPMGALNSEYSTIAVSIAVKHDGFDSWKIHFFNMVDEFRRKPDLRLLMLAPTKKLDERLNALLASIVCSLCAEVGYETPDWAAQEYFLDRPWFVSEMESLKATAMVESPHEFRRNNIFVHENILKRA